VKGTFSPYFLSYEDINSHAESFLATHNPRLRLPVPIEEIAEFNLRIDIFPFPNLQRTFDIEGFISGDLSCIYVDDFIYSNRPRRYRFTLAHEIGHFVLHKELIQNIRPKSIPDWKDFIDNIDEETRNWLEWQAYTFGGLVLVPRTSLVGHFQYELDSLKDKIALVKSKNLPVDSYQEYVIDAIANKLVKTYDVSRDVLVKRISKEIEKGFLAIS
jgi:Zn-dependent peptidase ImmA (M78 family)